MVSVYVKDQEGGEVDGVATLLPLSGDISDVSEPLGLASPETDGASLSSFPSPLLLPSSELGDFAAADVDGPSSDTAVASSAPAAVVATAGIAATGNWGAAGSIFGDVTAHVGFAATAGGEPFGGGEGVAVPAATAGGVAVTGASVAVAGVSLNARAARRAAAAAISALGSVGVRVPGLMMRNAFQRHGSAS